MVAEDLMVGDWVCVRSNDKEDTHNFKIKSIVNEGVYGPGFVGFDEDLEPIPLTGEILKKSGFKHIQDTYLFNIGINQFGIDLWIEIGPDSWIENNKIYIDSLKEIDDTMVSVTTCKYVHELQHLLKSLKIRKDIVL
jgi:hypothetical protein